MEEAGGRVPPVERTHGALGGPERTVGRLKQRGLLQLTDQPPDDWRAGARKRRQQVARGPPIVEKVQNVADQRRRGDDPVGRIVVK
jgi:hypothetical protein